MLNIDDEIINKLCLIFLSSVVYEIYSNDGGGDGAGADAVAGAGAG